MDYFISFQDKINVHQFSNVLKIYVSLHAFCTSIRGLEYINKSQGVVFGFDGMMSEFVSMQGLISPSKKGHNLLIGENNFALAA